MTDLAVVDITAGFGHLKPAHVTDCFLGACQRIFYRFLKSVRRGTNELNFLVNMIRHVSIISRRIVKNNKKPILEDNRVVC